jgi:hypothetical protein
MPGATPLSLGQLFSFGKPTVERDLAFPGSAAPIAEYWIKGLGAAPRDPSLVVPSDLPNSVAAEVSTLTFNVGMPLIDIALVGGSALLKREP